MQSNIPTVLKSNGLLIRDSEELRELLSNTFAQNERLTGSVNPYILADLTFTPGIARDAIQTLLRSLGKGHAGILINLIKYEGSYIHILLNKIFNLSFDSGLFPCQ